jgi:chromosome segregation ATPase
LDFLKSELAKALNNIKGEQGNITSYIQPQNSWKNKLIDLSKDYQDCLTKKCREKVQGEENYARQQVAFYQGRIDSAKARIKDAEQRRDIFQQKIVDYQQAVQQAISIGVTDGGAVEIAEMEVEKAKAELKNLQSKPMRTYFIIGSVVVLGVVGALIFRKR